MGRNPDEKQWRRQTSANSIKSMGHEFMPHCAWVCVSYCSHLANELLGVDVFVSIKLLLGDGWENCLERPLIGTIRRMNGLRCEGIRNGGHSLERRGWWRQFLFNQGRRRSSRAPSWDWEKPRGAKWRWTELGRTHPTSPSTRSAGGSGAGRRGRGPLLTISPTTTTTKSSSSSCSSITTTTPAHTARDGPTHLLVLWRMAL